MPVTAGYQSIRDRIVAGNDRFFGEPVRLSFLKDGVVDPDRQMIEIEAVLRVGGGKETMVSGRSTDGSWRSRIEAQRGELYIDRTRYPDIEVRQGDRVKALSRQDEPWFEVLAVDDRGMARLVLQLGEA